MANWSLPSLGDLYADFVSYFKARDLDLAKGLDPAKVTVDNPVTDMIRWSSANNKWQRFNGTSWGDLSSTYAINISGSADSCTGNAATATTAGTCTGNAATASDAAKLGGQLPAYYLPSSSYTAADVLSKIKTVDGAASGLDADLLDGVNSDGFALSKFLGDVDLNTITQSGCYRINVATNRPPNTDFGSLLHIRGGVADTAMQICSDYGGHHIYWRSGSGIGGTPVWSPWVKLKGQNFVSADSAYTAKPNEAVVQWGAFDITLPQSGLVDGDEVSVCFFISATNYVRRGAAGGYMGSNGLAYAEDIMINKSYTWVTFRYVWTGNPNWMIV